MSGTTAAVEAALLGHFANVGKTSWDHPEQRLHGIKFLVIFIGWLVVQTHHLKKHESVGMIIPKYSHSN